MLNNIPLFSMIHLFSSSEYVSQRRTLIVPFFLLSFLKTMYMLLEVTFNSGRTFWISYQLEWDFDIICVDVFAVFPGLI